MKSTDIAELSKLSIPEKILLVEDIWDSISKEESEIPVPKSHKAELDRRAGYPGKLLSLEELTARIEKRK
jgi:putative addiction module component (TIGR02574 family)